MAALQDFDVQKLDLKIVSLNISGLRKKTKFVKYFLSKYKPDILCLQETNVNNEFIKNRCIYELGADENKSFFNYANSKSNGTAVICFSPLLKCNNVDFYDEGRTIFLDISQNLARLTVINVYVPTNSTQRLIFFDSLLYRIGNYPFYNNNIILSGDFNITLDDIDITGIKGTNRIGRPELRNIIDSFKFKDSFRTLFPYKIETTFENKNILRASRIDRIYVSEHLPVVRTEHIASSLDFTDHKAVIVYLSNLNNHQRTKTKAAHWKFNDTLLESDEFVNAVRETLHSFFVRTTL